MRWRENRWSLEGKITEPLLTSFVGRVGHVELGPFEVREVESPRRRGRGRRWQRREMGFQEAKKLAGDIPQVPRSRTLLRQKTRDPPGKNIDAQALLQARKSMTDDVADPRSSHPAV